MANKDKITRPWYKKAIIGIWALFGLGILSIVVYIFAVSIDMFGLFGGLPSYKSLENPKSDLSSELYSADGALLGKYFRTNRSKAAYEELPEHLTNALLATEDIRFYDHSGIDLRSLFRVFFFSVLLNKDAGGGSTITQQLAKNLFRTRGEQYDGKLAHLPLVQLVISKTKEWIVAVQLERNYTKKEIITMYFNTVPYGSNAFGIKVASETFFNKEPEELNVQESAVLVGVVNAPTRYSPIINPEQSKDRRNVVLDRLKTYNYISEETYDTLHTKPIELEYKVESQNVGLATYFRSAIRPQLLYWCREHGYDLFEDGLKIYTTLDSRMQKYAEKAVEEHMKILQQQFSEHWEGRNPWIDEDGEEIEGFLDKKIKQTDAYEALHEKYGDDSVAIYKKLNEPKKMEVFSWNGDIDTVMSTIDSLKYYKNFLHTGFMAMNPHNGHIKAWVGGIDYEHFKFDHVKQGRRQPGSTFKPIVYTAAIDNGYSPCYEVYDVPVTFKINSDPPTTWTPKNANSQYTGNKMTIRQAMSRSVNSITAFVMKKLGPKTVVEYGERLGIESPLAAVPSLCLGTSDVSVYELVGAYSTFVNQGVYTKPFFISRIEDKNGNVLQNFLPRTREALSEETAYLMLHMLRGTTEEPGGTGMGLSMKLREDNEIGAKTGTTQNASDGWFVGITKDLAAGAWVGGDSRTIHFRNWYMGQGARTAMPIWERFMLDVYNDEDLNISKGTFKRPTKPLSVEIDCSTYREETQPANQGIQNGIQGQPNPEDIF